MLTRLGRITAWITVASGAGLMVFAAVPPLQVALLSAGRTALEPPFFMGAARMVFAGVALGVLCEISNRLKPAANGVPAEKRPN